MNKKESIDQKLANFLSGTNTEKEKEDVESWVKHSKKNAHQFRELLKIWIERSPDRKLIDHDNVKSSIWATFQNEDQQSQIIEKRSLPLTRFWKVAAVIIALIAASFLIVFVTKEAPIQQEITAERTIQKRNPAGQKSQIQLPDGSKVWLNADSEISFKENFSDSIRSIHLQGEAYFEVIHDALRPFEVHTDKVSVSVLGTGFNVSAYNDENDIIVALVHGSVKVQMIDGQAIAPILLTPGKGVNYSRSIDEFQDFSMQDNDVLYKRLTEWKYGTLVFDGQDFQSFVKELSRWYGVQVKVQGDPPKAWQVRGTFENEYLNTILDAVSFNKDFSYHLNNKELTLMFN